MHDTHTDGSIFKTGYDACMFYGQFLIGAKFNLNDPTRKAMYRDLYSYFARSPKSILNPDKGLLMIGDLGVGKSICLKTMNLIFRAFKYSHAKMDIERCFKEFGEVATLAQYGYDLKNSLLIDDAGVEEDEIFNYKNKIYLIGEILLERYDLYQANPKMLTHMATNVRTDELEGRYGKRNFDRFHELFNVITWEGASLRRA